LFLGTCLFTSLVTQLKLLNPCVLPHYKKEWYQYLSASPTINYTQEKWGGHCASFVALLCSLHSTRCVQTCKKLLCTNPVTTESAGEKSQHAFNNQLCIEKWGGHFVLFVAMLHSLHVHRVTNKQQCKKLLCNESRSLQKTTSMTREAITNQHLALSAKKEKNWNTW